MKIPIYIIFTFIFIGKPSSLNAQITGPTDFLGKVNELKALMTEANGVLPKITDSLNYNERIAKRLFDILSDKKSVNYDLDTLLKHDFLSITHSADHRMWFFGWAENSDGTFRGGLNIIQFRTTSNLPQVKCDEFNTDDNAFSSFGVSYSQIFKLPSEKDIYLCVGSVTGCSTCLSEIALVIELTNDNINFNYPAFFEDEANYSGESSLILNSRRGSITKFDYDEKRHTITYEYTPDDLTPVNRDEETPTNNSAIKTVLYWHGISFN